MMVELETGSPNSFGLPMLEAPAPDFDAVTTDGPKRLADYKGRWLVLFSHPADFTPVCTTEFIAFAQRFDQFQQLNVDLLGLSIDSVYSHLAWLDSIEKDMGVKVPFPIIADLDMKVATAYGMVHPGADNTSAVRAVFVIDPDQKLRAMVYYPLTNGRSIDEILRLIKALQTHDEHNVATPENWQPGEPVIVKPPATKQESEKRAAEADGMECKAWYFWTKKL